MSVCRSGIQVKGEGLWLTVVQWSTGAQDRGAGMHLEHKSCCLRPVYRWREDNETEVATFSGSCVWAQETGNEDGSRVVTFPGYCV